MLVDTKNLLQWTDPNDAAFTILGIAADTNHTTIDSFGTAIRLLKPLDLSVWITAQRPALDASGHIIGFASDTRQLELWDGVQWSQVLTSSNNGIGYTPVNKAGDTMSGALAMGANLLSGSSVSFTGGTLTGLTISGGTFSGTIAGNPNYSGVPVWQTTGTVGTSAGTQSIIRFLTAAGSNRDLQWFSGGTAGANLRWRQRVDTAEGGANAGANMRWTALDDSGTSLGDALVFTRSDLHAKFGGYVQAGTLYFGNPAYTFTTSAQATNQYGINGLIQTLSGTVTDGDVHANRIQVTADNAVVTAGALPASLYLMYLNHKVGNTAWQQSTVYALNDTADANGNTYKATTGGTSSNAGAGPSGTGASITDGSVVWAYQIPAWRGKRSPLFANLSISSQSSGTSDAELQLQAAVFQTTITAPQGGTGTGNGLTNGFVYGGGSQMYAKPGALNLSGVVGWEFDVGIYTGASAGERRGIQVSSQGDLQGAQSDVGVLVYSSFKTTSGATMSPGYKNVFATGNGAVDSSGTILGYIPPYPGSLSPKSLSESPPKAAYGVDFNPYLFSVASLRLPGGTFFGPDGYLNLGSFKASSSSAGAALDIPGATVTAIALNTSQNGYVVGDQLNGPYGSIITVTTIDGVGKITGFTVNELGGTTSNSPSTTGVAFSSGTGSGCTFDLTFSTGKALALNPSGDTRVGQGSVGATTDTLNHLLIPFCAGAPTGIPTNASTGIALRYDTTNHKLWAYDNVASAWKGVALT